MAVLEGLLPLPDEFSDEVKAAIMALGLPEVEPAAEMMLPGAGTWWDYENQEWSTATKPHTIPDALLAVLPTD